VGEALDAVFDQHDGLRERITQDRDLRRFVNVYVSAGHPLQDGSTPPSKRRVSSRVAAAERRSAGSGDRERYAVG
jgi:hypothetical protein